MLHSSDSIERFNDRADDYVQYRPGYPAAAIDAILEGLGDPATLRAADVGAGTGISARLLGDHGVPVIAIEPGAAMRNAAAPHHNVRWLSARAEATGLSAASVDLVVCAQSFHWFQSPEAVAEFARILKPAGRLAIMWNRRSRVDALTAGYRQAILDVGGETAAERIGFDVSVVNGSGLFGDDGRVAFRNEQVLDVHGLIGRARSASLVPKTGDAGRRLDTLLRELHGRHADARGFVRLIYETEVFRFTRNR